MKEVEGILHVVTEQERVDLIQDIFGKKKNRTSIEKFKDLLADIWEYIAHIYRSKVKLRHNYVFCPKLSGDWCDADFRMLHACFSLFSEFVERENGLRSLRLQWLILADPDGTFNVDSYLKEKNIENTTDEQIKALNYFNDLKQVWKEAAELYAWWQSYNTECFTDNEYDLESKQLLRLMNIRQYLWT